MFFRYYVCLTSLHLSRQLSLCSVSFVLRLLPPLALLAFVRYSLEISRRIPASFSFYVLLGVFPMFLQLYRATQTYSWYDISMEMYGEDISGEETTVFYAYALFPDSLRCQDGGQGGRKDGFSLDTIVELVDSLPDGADLRIPAALSTIVSDLRWWLHCHAPRWSRPLYDPSWWHLRRYILRSRIRRMYDAVSVFCIYRAFSFYAHMCIRGYSSSLAEHAASEALVTSRSPEYISALAEHISSPIENYYGTPEYYRWLDNHTRSL